MDKSISWSCNSTWKKARVNTMWCLIGCAIGDFGTIFYFQSIDHTWSTTAVMSLAIVNGLKKRDFDNTMGIHPSSAEEIVTLREKRKKL